MVIKLAVKNEQAARETVGIGGKFKDNGCSFFGYCMGKLGMDSGSCACMNATYYLNKLKENCEILNEKRRIFPETIMKLKTLKENNKVMFSRNEAEKHRCSNAAQVYLRIFGGFEKDPLADWEIAERVFALTGSRPSSKNISSYRCMYNRGKIKGQESAPVKKVGRVKGKVPANLRKKIKEREEVNKSMAKKAVVKKTKTVITATKAKEVGGETKESKLIKLLSGKDLYTLDEIIRHTGFAQASAKMYVSNDYLKRKDKPYKVVTGKKGGKEAYRMVKK